MKHSSIQAAATLVVLFCGTACVSDAVTGESKYALVQWTAEEELEMGREGAPNIESQFDAVYPDVAANAFLRELVADMVTLSPRRDDFDFHFKVLNSSIPNAFALPGGYVYITRGLLREVESEGQFISIVGHELGHVEHRHAMLNQSQGAILGLPARPLRALARILPIGHRIVGLVAAIVDAPSVLLGLKYSREQELEADDRGIYFSAKMGYDPYDSIHTFELFKRLESQASNGWADYSIFRTHPLNDDRIECIEKTIRRDYPDLAKRPAGSFRQGSPAFDAIVAGLRANDAAYELYDQASEQFADPEVESIEALLAVVGQARGMVPDEPLFHILEGEMQLVLEREDLAIERFVAAIELYRVHAPGDGHWKPHLYVGAFALQQDDPPAAVRHLRRASELYPMNGEAHFLLGAALEAAGESKEAAREYRRAIEILPSDSEECSVARERLRVLEK